MKSLTVVWAPNSRLIRVLIVVRDEMVWAQKFGIDIGSSTPVIDDCVGVLYLASNEVRTLDTDDREVVWETSFYGTNVGSSPVFDRNNVYVGNASGRVYVFPTQKPRSPYRVTGISRRGTSQLPQIWPSSETQSSSGR